MLIAHTQVVAVRSVATEPTVKNLECQLMLPSLDDCMQAHNISDGKRRTPASLREDRHGNAVPRSVGHLHNFPPPSLSTLACIIEGTLDSSKHIPTQVSMSRTSSTAACAGCSHSFHCHLFVADDATDVHVRSKWLACQVLYRRELSGLLQRCRIPRARQSVPKRSNLFCFRELG